MSDIIDRYRRRAQSRGLEIPRNATVHILNPSKERPEGTGAYVEAQIYIPAEEVINGVPWHVIGLISARGGKTSRLASGDVLISGRE